MCAIALPTSRTLPISVNNVQANSFPACSYIWRSTSTLLAIPQNLTSPNNKSAQSSSTGRRHHAALESVPPRHNTSPRRSLVLAAAAARADGALCDKSDKAALLAIKSALGNHPELSGWNSTVPCCSWPGISCDTSTGRVTDLTVFALNISAPVPAAIANLTALRTVNLAYNRLDGPIPEFLGPPALPGLNFLRLDGNRLDGTIPPMATVYDLSLVGNNLTGPLPATFADAEFGDVDLADNQLTGDASMFFGAKKKVNALRLSRNRFAFDLGRVELPEALDILAIDHNMIYGSIPAAAAERKWLAFDVSYNSLCGPIPQGRYTHRLGPKHLCGRPLAPCS